MPTHPPTHPATRHGALRTTLAAAACTVVVAGGCGQLTVGEEAGTTTRAATSTTAAPEGGPPTPGPDATAGCEELAGPVSRLVAGKDGAGAGAVAGAGTGAGPDTAAAEVRRLADQVEDNALSTVASRLSGLLVQPAVDPVAVDTEWDQFATLCDLG